jgi:SAM-dependent methyltransferase
MTWAWALILVVTLAALLAIAYWQLIVAEGAYLGPRVVTWTYDLVARRYDAIKQFRPHDESWFVAGPVLRGLVGVARPLVLDVATGTGRLPLALLRERFGGQIVGLDLSRGMLRQARANLHLYTDRVTLVWQDASRLPFGEGAFDAVICLESLEFMPRPLEVLAEMVRVLAPGGLLFLTNRVGREAPLLPGKAFPRPAFEGLLADLPLRDVEVRPWQVNYDLAVARKEGDQGSGGHGAADVTSLLRCPACAGPLRRGVASLSCAACGRHYPIREGFVHLASDGERGQA